MPGSHDGTPLVDPKKISDSITWLEPANGASGCKRTIDSRAAMRSRRSGLRTARTNAAGSAPPRSSSCALPMRPRISTAARAAAGWFAARAYSSNRGDLMRAKAQNPGVVAEIHRLVQTAAIGQIVENRRQRKQPHLAIFWRQRHRVPGEPGCQRPRCVLDRTVLWHALLRDRVPVPDRCTPIGIRLQNEPMLEVVSGSLVERLGRFGFAGNLAQQLHQRGMCRGSHRRIALLGQRGAE